MLMWTQGAVNLTLNVAKWVSYKSLNKRKLASTSINVCMNVNGIQKKIKRGVSPTKNYLKKKKKKNYLLSIHYL